MIGQPDKIYQARIELIAHLADYWFNREHPGWYALDPDTMQPEMTEDEALAGMQSLGERLWMKTDEQLDKLQEVTLNDLMRLSPLRNMSPKGKW